MSEENEQYIYIQEEELEKLKYYEKQYFKIKNIESEKINQISHETELILKDKIERLQKRVVENQLYMYDLNGTIRYIEIENQRRLIEQSKKLDNLRDDLFNFIRKIPFNYFSELPLHLENFEKFIEKERKNISEIKSNLNILLDEKQKKYDTIKKFSEELTVLITETSKIPHEKFAPGKFKNIKKNLTDLVEDIESGFFESAINTARRAYRELNELRENVFSKEQEFITLHTLSIQSSEYLKELVIKNETHIMKFGNTINPSEINVDVDFWTNGKLKKLKNQIKAINSEIKINENNLSLDEIKDIIRVINSLKGNLEELIKDSRYNIISSQVIFNIAQKIADILKKQAFKIIESGYENEDQRKPYKLKMKHFSGSEYLFMISSEENLVGNPEEERRGFLKTNKISIYTYDDKNISEKIFHMRNNELLNLLKNEGLIIYEFKIINQDKKNKIYLSDVEPK